MKYFLVILPVLSLMGLSLIGCDQSGSGKGAGKTVHGKVFEYGIYSALRKGRERGDLTTNTGKVVTLPVLKLAEQTDRIPLVKGTYFAYRYRVMDLPKKEAKKPAVDLRKVLVHPAMTLPDGTETTGWDRVTRGRTSIGQVIAFDGYVFNEDYELVEGDWIFQIWFGETMVAEQKFTTYWPDDKSADKPGENSDDAQKSVEPADKSTI